MAASDISTTGEDTPPRSSMRTVVLASFVGTAIEWYDFFLYGTAAALVFNKLFFPSFEPAAGLLAAFATFAVGYAARPIGGLIFGHFGDRVGRKKMLIISLLIMGIGTFAIGLLPTFESIGVMAPILLVLMRIAQGIGIGGEWGGAVLLTVEHSPRARRGFYGSSPQMGVPAGLLLSTAAFGLTRWLTTDEAFLSYGWRIPFLLSGVLVLVGYFVRLKVLESPAFQTVKTEKAESRMPLVDVVKAYPRQLLVGAGMRAAESVIFPVFTVFVLSYGEGEGIAEGTLLTGVIISSAIGLISIPAWAALSDRYSRRSVYLAGAVFSMLFAFPFFWLVGSGTPILIWLAIVLGINVGHNLMYGPQATLFAELFGTKVRYSGVSIVYQITSVIAGGLAPLIATSLLVANDGNPALVAGYVAAVSALAVVATYFAPRANLHDIDTDHTDERLLARSQRGAPTAAA
ncbi:MAG: MHS family MFS transporter [Geodermatophilaceae bacterium]|nr:MHS family MFS transporter [Geodermatophilaceae bacterium]